MKTLDCHKIKPMADKGLHEKIIRLMDSEKRGAVLDLAVGEGALSCELNNLGFDVVGGDLNKDNFKLHGDIPFIQYDLNKQLPIGEKKFDYICAIEIIEHIENPYKLIRDCNSLLKKNGLLIISTPNITNYKSRLTFLLFGRFSGFFPHDKITSGHINPIPFWELKDILEENGFGIKLIATSGLNLNVTPKYTPKSLFLKSVYVMGLILVPFIQNWGFGGTKKLKMGNILIVKAKKR